MSYSSKNANKRNLEGRKEENLNKVDPKKTWTKKFLSNAPKKIKYVYKSLAEFESEVHN